MQQTNSVNTIVNKYLLPYYIAAAGFLTIGGATACVIDKTHQQNKYAVEQGYIDAADALPYFLSILVILTCLGGFGFCSIYEPQKANKFANKVVYKYLSKKMYFATELKPYADILHNRKALQEIAAFLANNLPESDKELILQHVKTLIETKVKSDAEYNELLERTIKHIIWIVKHNVNSDIVLTRDLYKMIEKCHKTYVLPNNQHVR